MTLKEKAFYACGAAGKALCSLEEFKVAFEKFFQPCWGYDEATWIKTMELNAHEMCILSRALSTLLCEAMDNAKQACRATADAFVQVPMTTVLPGGKAPGRVLYLKEVENHE